MAIFSQENANKAAQHDAYVMAVRALGVREYNEHEMREKLGGKGFDAIIIDQVIDQLKTYDYLNEQRYAESFLRSRVRKGDTPKLAAYKASQKGADASALQDALLDADGKFDACDACRSILNKRDPQGLRKHDQRIWQRQMRYLQSKGYEISTILQVMHEETE